MPVSTSSDEFEKTSLTDRVSERLEQDIRAGLFKPGEQLPTGQALAQRFGVSLTVVREAISSLKAEGLIQTRQGAGAFVSTNSLARPFRLNGKAPRHITPQQLFELRTGIEMQAAMLAATRASDAHIRKIETAFKAMQRDVAQGRDSVASDVAFHRAIAQASGNQLFPAFLDFLSDHIAGTIQASREGDAWARHQHEVMQEHQAVMEAIRQRSPDAAQSAAEVHMNNCLKRCLPLAGCQVN